MARLREGRITVRLSASSQQIIRETTREVFGAEARVRLFGSGLDDSQRGGDIDLLVELPQMQKESRRKSLTLAALLQMKLGDQPIDILVIDPETPLQAIHHQAIETGDFL
jgi:predicted nucleotidyltransferase